MKMNIKELKERGEKDDKVKFSAKVITVYDAKELTPEQKAKSKYTFSRQNAIVDDESESIKVIISHKTKEDEYGQDVVGKIVDVDGKISIWNEEKNIFGKFIFKPGEGSSKPPKESQSVVQGTKPKASMPIVVEVKKISLELAITFRTARVGEKMEETKVIKPAKMPKMQPGVDIPGNANVPAGDIDIAGSTSH